MTQSYDKSNIMEEIRSTFGRLSTGYKTNLLKYAYQRDPHSILDETLLAIWVLLALAVCFTVGFGFYYHYSMLQSAFGAGVWATVGSFAIFVVVEIVTVFFGLALTRLLFSLLWWRSFLHLFFLSGLALITVVGFAWSIRISTKGVAQVNESLKTARLYESQTFTPPSHLEDIDKEINRLEEAKRAGAASTWRGRTTREGLAVISENAAMQKTLIERREKEMTAARMQFDSLQAVQRAQITSTATLLADYGGKAEYAKIILIFLIVCFEYINWRKNKPDASPATQAGTQYKDLTQQAAKPDPTIWNERKIGFQIPSKQPAQHNITACDTSNTTQHSTATQHSNTTQTTVIVAPSEDVTKLKNYARTYYERSLKPTSNPETKQANREKYLEYKSLLEIAGFTVLEAGRELRFEKR